VIPPFGLFSTNENALRVIPGYWRALLRRLLSPDTIVQFVAVNFNFHRATGWLSRLAQVLSDGRLGRMRVHGKINIQVNTKPLFGAGDNPPLEVWLGVCDRWNIGSYCRYTFDMPKPSAVHEMKSRFAEIKPTSGSVAWRRMYDAFLTTARTVSSVDTTGW